MLKLEWNLKFLPRALFNDFPVMKKFGMQSANPRAFQSENLKFNFYTF